MNAFEYIWLTRVRKQLTVHRPLNYMNYDTELARDELKQEYEWRDYGGKHSESRFTKFYQDIYLLKKFGFDKRRIHLSSLIVSGQCTRKDALIELEQPVITPQQAKRDTKFVAKKLGLTVEQLQSYTASPPVDHRAYPNRIALYWAFSIVKNLLRRLSNLRV